MSYPFIEASEIAEYVYCNRAWWLRTEVGYRPQNRGPMAAGVAYHDAHGRQVGQARAVRRVALLLLFLAVAIAVFWLIRAS
jgi:hypothetical protein